MIRIKLGNQCGQASKGDDKEPNGEEATEESSFSNHLAHPHLGYIYMLLGFKKLQHQIITFRTFPMPILAEIIEVE